MARHCPQCGTRVNAEGVCDECGYGRSSGKRDPEPFRCAHTVVGVRCPMHAPFSHSTNGGGPWYCAAHFRRGADLDRYGPPGGFEPLRRIIKPLRELVPKDTEDFAERAAIQSEGKE